MKIGDISGIHTFLMKERGMEKIFWQIWIYKMELTSEILSEWHLTILKSHYK